MTLRHIHVANTRRKRVEKRECFIAKSKYDIEWEFENQQRIILLKDQLQ